MFDAEETHFSTLPILLSSDRFPHSHHFAKLLQLLKSKRLCKHVGGILVRLNPEKIDRSIRYAFLSVLQRSVDVSGLLGVTTILRRYDHCLIVAVDRSDVEIVVELVEERSDPDEIRAGGGEGDVFGFERRFGDVLLTTGGGDNEGTEEEDGESRR